LSGGSKEEEFEKLVERLEKLLSKEEELKVKIEQHLSRLREIEEKRHAGEFGRYRDIYKYNVTLAPRERKLLLEAYGAGRLLDHVASVTMPDATPPEIEFELKFDEDVILDWTCVPPGTDVYSNPGTVPIERLPVGGRLLGVHGEQKVLKTFSRRYEGKMVKIKPRYFEAVSFTPEHPILIAERERVHGSIGKVKNVVWKRAGEVKKGDFVIIPKDLFKEEEHVVDFRIYSSRKPRKIPERVSLTPQLAELFGFYLSEGSVGKAGTPVRGKSDLKANFDFGRHERENVERVLELLRHLNLKGYVKGRGTSIRVEAGSQPLARFLAENFGRGAHSKRIPSFIMNAKREIVQAFLKGCWAGDGCVTKHRSGKPYHKYVTCSKALAKQIQMLLLKIGIPASVYEHHRGRSAIRGRELVDSIGYYVVFSERKRREWIEDEKFYYIPVDDVKEEHYEGYVYNVKTTENVYLVPFVVHNCNEYYSLIGFWPPVSGYGGCSIYDTVNRRYAWWTTYVPELGDFSELLQVWLANLTDVTVTVNVWDVQLRLVAPAKLKVY
jgi:intein/homing endonuclease